MPNKPKYSQGEKLLCFHGPLLYEAKCVEIDVDGDDVRYFVHYQGWNKTWDEWIIDDRIIKFNEAGLKKQKELQEEYRESRKKKSAKKKSLGENKKKQNRRKVGSASDASNRSVHTSEDGKESRAALDEDMTIEDTGTSIMSEEIGHLDESVISRKSTGSGSRKRGRKRKISDKDGDVDWGTGGGSGSLVEDIVADRNDMEEVQSTDTTGGGRDDIGMEDPIVERSTATTSSVAKHTGSLSGAAGKSRKKVLVPLDENITDLETYGSSINAETLQFTLSEKLRFWLTDDWDLVTRQSRLTHLPARLTVNDILGRYRIFVDQIAPEPGESESHSNKTKEMRLELIDGLRKYFNVSLGSMLLYKFERLQYFDVVNKNSNKSELSATYGPIHILRLLVNIQKLITYTRTDKVSLQCLSALLQHFVDFLDSSCEEFFKLEDYITATADYRRRAMC